MYRARSAPVAGRAVGYQRLIISSRRCPGFQGSSRPASVRCSVVVPIGYGPVGSGSQARACRSPPPSAPGAGAAATTPGAPTTPSTAVAASSTAAAARPRPPMMSLLVPVDLPAF